MTARARNSDSITSHMAAEHVEATGAAHGQRETVRRGLLRFGAYGLTSAELARITGMERHKVARRLPELLDHDIAKVRVLKTGNAAEPWTDEKRRCTASGRMAKVWRPVAPRARDLG